MSDIWRKLPDALKPPVISLGYSGEADYKLPVIPEDEPRPVFAGQKILEMFAQRGWDRTDKGIPLRLIDLSGEQTEPEGLPGEPLGVEADQLPIVKKDITPREVVDIVRNILETRRGSSRQ